MIWDSCLEAGEHDGFKLFHNRTNFHTGNQKYFNLKAKLFYLLQRLKMGNFLLNHPSPAEINGNKVKSVFSYRLQHQKPLVTRDPRTKTDRSKDRGPTRTKTESILKKLGPNRTRIKYFQKIMDRTGPGPSKFRKSRTELDQDQQNLENLGPKRTRTNNIWKISDQVGPIGPRTMRPVSYGVFQDKNGIKRFFGFLLKSLCHL